MYPLSKEDNISGIFVKEQIESLEKEQGFNFDIFNLQKFTPLKRYTIAQLKIIKFLKRNNFSNIHIHYAISGLFLLLYKPKANVVITFHGSDILPGDGSFKKKIQTFLSKKIAKKADKLILVSDHMLPLLKKYENKCSVIPCGINLDFFNQTQPLVQEIEKVVIFPSNPNRVEKNYPLFKKIITETQKKNPSIIIKEQTFVNMNREEVRTALWQADCLLLTSISEGSPQVVKEAMACSLPIISRAVGDVKILLKDVDNAFVVESDEIEKYVSYLSAILMSKTRSKNSVNKLHELELDNISISKKIAKLYV